MEGDLSGALDNKAALRICAVGVPPFSNPRKNRT